MTQAVNVAIYIRVSTEEQAKEGFSIAAQKERLTQFAQSQDWDIFDFYVDEGLSAKDMNRPELQRMLEDIQKGSVQVVLVYKLDRLTRSLINLFELLQIFDKANVGFKSATEVFDTTTAIGRLFITIIAALAQWERENLAERVKFGMEQMVLEKRWHGASPPFGYDLADGRLVKNETEAYYVKRMFEMYAKGIGRHRIARWMNAQKAYTKKGQLWAEFPVGYVLANPVYIGKLRWNVGKGDEYFEVEDACEPIVDASLFEKVQSVRDSKKHLHPRQKSSDFVFTGFLRCSRCGFAMSGRTTTNKSGRYKYYKCIGSQRNRCDMPMTQESLIEKQFLAALKYIRDESALHEVAAGHEPVMSDATMEQIEKIRKEIEKLKINKKKWHRAYADGAIDLEEMKELTREDKEREVILLAELDLLNGKTIQKQKKLTTDELLLILDDFEEHWSRSDDIEKKHIVAILCKEIRLSSTRLTTEKTRGVPFEIQLDIEFN